MKPSLSLAAGAQQCNSVFRTEHDVQVITGPLVMELLLR